MSALGREAISALSSTAGRLLPSFCGCLKKACRDRVTAESGFGAEQESAVSCAVHPLPAKTHLKKDDALLRVLAFIIHDHLGREALAHLQGGRAVSGPGFDVCLAQMALDLSVSSGVQNCTSLCQLLRFWRGRACTFARKEAARPRPLQASGVVEREQVIAQTLPLLEFLAASRGR